MLEDNMSDQNAWPYVLFRLKMLPHTSGNVHKQRDKLFALPVHLLRQVTGSAGTAMDVLVTCFSKMGGESERRGWKYPARLVSSGGFARRLGKSFCFSFLIFSKCLWNIAPAILLEPPSTSVGLHFGTPFGVFFRCFFRSLQSKIASKAWQAWPYELWRFKLGFAFYIVPQR